MSVFARYAPATGVSTGGSIALHVAGIEADEIAALGIVGARARCLTALASAVLDRKVSLSFAADVEAEIEALMRLPGVGVWTAQYIAMRALHWPDAFPSGDLMLLRAANASPRQLQNLAQACRPWRAYAANFMAVTRSESMNAFTYFDSPIGRLLLTSDRTALTGLYMEQSRKAQSTDGWAQDDAALPLVLALRQLHEYFGGTRRTFDLPLRLAGTDFQQRVWRGLREIPYGQTSSYGQLACRIGRPGASRAVGLANGRNPISIVVPCHRVIGADGSLTGYGGGLERKQWLLAHEAVLARQSVSCASSRSQSMWRSGTEETAV